MKTNNYIENQKNFPAEELLKHVGKYVAWNPDGSKIIASDEDPLKVLEAIDASEHDPGECAIESVPDCSIVLRLD